MTSVCSGEVQVGHQEQFLFRKSVGAVAQAAQAGAGVAVPEGVQGTFGHCVEGYSLVRTTDDGWMVGLDDPVGLFQPW